MTNHISQSAAEAFICAATARLVTASHYTADMNSSKIEAVKDAQQLLVEALKLLEPKEDL